MSKFIKFWNRITGQTINIEAIDETDSDYVKKGWIPDQSDLAERKRERDDNWGINPSPDDSGFAEWSRGRK